jgi:putative oxidoreductase
VGQLLSFSSIGLLLLRVGCGIVFVAHGYPKMTGRGKDERAGRRHLAKSIAQLGLPFPSLLAITVGMIEFFGGMLLIIGLRTRLAALALALIMLVAAGRNLSQKSFVGSADFPFTLLVAMLALAFLGGGRLGADRILFGGS